MFQCKRQVIDNDTRQYHSKIELTKKRIEAASKGAPPLDAEDTMVGVGITMGLSAVVIDPSAPVENPILEAVLEIGGVESACVTPYVLMVKKSPSFKWSEIERKVLRLFASLHMALEDSKITQK